jgi:CRP/FNR family transcriptional regulator, nitrogen fixation regulation protein
MFAQPTPDFDFLLPNGLEAPSCAAGQRATGQLTCFRANSEIYAPGDRVAAIYRVEFGAVRICRLLSDGRRQIIGFHLPGEVFGFEAEERHGFFAEAVCASGVRSFRLPPEVEIARQLLPVAVRALIRAQEHMLVIGRQNAAERVAAFLLDMMERQGGLERIELPMSRTDIGDYLGLTIETVSRAFSRFRETGQIKLVNARTVEIARPESLRAMCE